MHLWKYVGWLMGVDADFLVDDEWERHRMSYHVLLAQTDISGAGPQLAQSIVAGAAPAPLPRAGRSASRACGRATSRSGC